MVLEYAPQFDVDLLSARVVKLVDTRDLKSLAARCPGSTPGTRTKSLGR